MCSYCLYIHCCLPRADALLHRNAHHSSKQAKQRTLYWSMTSLTCPLTALLVESGAWTGQAGGIIKIHSQAPKKDVRTLYVGKTNETREGACFKFAGNGSIGIRTFQLPLRPYSLLAARCVLGDYSYGPPKQQRTWQFALIRPHFHHL